MGWGANSSILVALTEVKIKYDGNANRCFCGENVLNDSFN